MNNILELVNTGSESLQASVTMYDIAGNPGTPLVIAIGPYGQYDLILSALPTFSPNSYGVIRIDVDAQDLSGRVAFYRPSGPNAAPGDDYEFVFAVPLQNSLSGSSHVGFNTFQPSLSPADSSNLVTNWLSIVNLDTSAPSKAFTIRRYGMNGGAALSSTRVIVPALGRIDIDGGHGEGPSVVGYNEIIPMISWPPTWRSLSATAQMLLLERCRQAIALPFHSQPKQGVQAANGFPSQELEEE